MLDGSLKFWRANKNENGIKYKHKQYVVGKLCKQQTTSKHRGSDDSSSPE